MPSNKRGPSNRPKPPIRPTRATASATAATTPASTTAQPATSNAISTAGAATKSTPAATSSAKSGRATAAGPNVRRGSAAALSRRQAAHEAYLAQSRRRRQYVTTGIVVVALLVVAFVIFQVLPQSKSTPATASASATTAPATSGTPQACAVVPAGTPAAAAAAPTVSGAPITTSDGLQYIDINQGCGATVTAGATVTVNYTGWVQGGAMFDSSVQSGRTPFQADLSPTAAQGVIKGWQEGIVGMKVGGVRRLIIPPALGYGSQAQSAIPANSTLVFDVSLISIP